MYVEILVSNEFCHTILIVDGNNKLSEFETIISESFPFRQMEGSSIHINTATKFETQLTKNFAAKKFRL